MERYYGAVTLPRANRVIEAHYGRSYIFQEGEFCTIEKKSIQAILKRYRDLTGYDVMFNTNGYHNIQMVIETADGNQARVNWPINPMTLWTANDLLKEGIVKRINVIPLSKKEYNLLVKHCY